MYVGHTESTQHNPKDTWVNVPLQDFTSHSDIDWNKSIPEIDAQLYAKYNLTDDEISFIESMIKPMGNRLRHDIMNFNNSKACINIVKVL